jgi:hypothetical protein
MDKEGRCSERESTVADGPQQIQIPTTWVGAEDVPVQFANAFAGVVAPGEIFLNVGSLVPPAIVGRTQEEREAQLRTITYIPVKPIARLGLTPDRLDELIRTLQETRTNYQDLMNAIQTQGGK